jgi:hypothetical protein
VLSGDAVVGRILKPTSAPIGLPWMWTLVDPHAHGRRPDHGFAVDREAAMAAFAKLWRRE